MTAKLLFLVFASLAWLWQPAMAAEPALYPVWWSPELELESIEGVEARLQRDLWPGTGEGLGLYPNGDPSLAKVHARNCKFLLRLSSLGYRSLSGNDIKVQHYNLAFCRAITLLGQAKPAQNSNLRDFLLNAEAVNFLPALVNLYPSCEFICYTVAANALGISLADFKRILAVDLTDDNQIIVWTRGWMTHLTIMARGDFNDDSVDDILLLAKGGATEGSYATTRLYLLTRDNPGVALRAVGAEEERCLDYDCHSLPPNIASYRESPPAPSPEDIGGWARTSMSETEWLEDSPHYPVWWAPSFELDDLKKVDARLRRKFWPGADLGIRLYKGQLNELDTAQATSCVSLEALTRAGYGLDLGLLHHSQLVHLLRCRAIALLKAANPARRSFLREFVFSETNVRTALAAFELLTASESERADELRLQQPVLTSGLGRLLAIDTPYSGQADVWTEGGRVLLSVVARGDWTGDGTEDLLLMAGASLSRYRPDLTDLCVITRESPGSALSLVQVAPYSCRRLGAYGSSTDGDDRNRFDVRPME